LKKGQAAKADVAISGIETEVLMASYVKDNTSQGKGWIFDFGSAVHVCSHKDMVNFLVAKEEGAVNVTGRDGMKKTRYNLISIRVIDEE